MFRLVDLRHGIGPANLTDYTSSTLSIRRVGVMGGISDIIKQYKHGA